MAQRIMYVLASSNCAVYCSSPVRHLCERTAAAKSDATGPAPAMLDLAPPTVASPGMTLHAQDASECAERKACGVQRPAAKARSGISQRFTILATIEVFLHNLAPQIEQHPALDLRPRQMGPMRILAQKA